MVGDKRVGKTSLTNRAVFDEFSENEKDTKVVQISQKTLFVEGSDKSDKWA